MAAILFRANMRAGLPSMTGTTEEGKLFDTDVADGAGYGGIYCFALTP
jgi:hypothetical protein